MLKSKPQIKKVSLVILFLLLSLFYSYSLFVSQSESHNDFSILFHPSICITAILILAAQGLWTGT